MMDSFLDTAQVGREGWNKLRGDIQGQEEL